MTNTANKSHLRIGVLLVILHQGCGKPAPQAVVASAPVPVATPAGTVEALEGQVTAQRAMAAAKARPLAVRDSVWPDDTVATGEQASVSIRLAHNNALWLLQGGQSRRVDSAAAWRAPKQAAAVALADRQAVPTTESAGRHSEQEAAQTGEAATRPIPAQAQDVASADKAAAARKQKIAEGIQKNGLLKILGSQNGNSAALRDVLGNVDGVDNDIANSLSGVGIAGGKLEAGGHGKGAKSRGHAVGLGSLGTVGGGSGGTGSASVQLETQRIADVSIEPQLRKGKAGKQELARFLTKARNAIRMAYERALRLNVALVGTVTVIAEVSDGTVTVISVLPQGQPEALVDCVTGPLKHMVEPGLDGVELKLAVKLALRP